MILLANRDPMGRESALDGTTLVLDAQEPTDLQHGRVLFNRVKGGLDLDTRGLEEPLSPAELNLGDAVVSFNRSHICTGLVRTMSNDGKRLSLGLSRHSANGPTGGYEHMEDVYSVFGIAGGDESFRSDLHRRVLGRAPRSYRTVPTVEEAIGIPMGKPEFQLDDVGRYLFISSKDGRRWTLGSIRSVSTEGDRLVASISANGREISSNRAKFRAVIAR